MALTLNGSGTIQADDITLSGNANVTGALTSTGALTATLTGNVTGNADSATKLSTATGSAPSYSARAWVNFQGTGTVTIRASGNVSSITDLGVGYYTVNFITVMPDINYCVVGSCNYDNLGGMTDFSTAIQSVTNATNVICHDIAGGTKYDPYAMNVAIFR